MPNRGERVTVHPPREDEAAFREALDRQKAHVEEFHARPGDTRRVGAVGRTNLPLGDAAAPD